MMVLVKYWPTKGDGSAGLISFLLFITWPVL